MATPCWQDLVWACLGTGGWRGDGRLWFQRANHTPLFACSLQPEVQHVGTPGTWKDWKDARQLIFVVAALEPWIQLCCYILSLVNSDILDNVTTYNVTATQLASLLPFTLLLSTTGLWGRQGKLAPTRKNYSQTGKAIHPRSPSCQVTTSAYDSILIHLLDVLHKSLLSMIPGILSQVCICVTME